MRLLLVVGLALCTQAGAQNGIIGTIAGNGSTDFSGDGGTAIAAALSNPTGVAVDTAGNLYIADASNHRIRKVSASGIMSTVAGNGDMFGYGDGGPATLASLSYPTSVAVDSSGSLYIGDPNSHVIRKVSANGMITTVAGNGIPGFSGDGGPATLAALQSIAGLAVDISGSIYFADTFNHRVRKVAANGVITTIAGNGNTGYSGDGNSATSASLSAPGGVALDTSGNLYISDTGNLRVRKVSADGIISTVAGSGAGGYAGDGGPAILAALSGPQGLALDSAGNLFLSDPYNIRIRKVTTTGIISTVAGSGRYGFSGDLGPAANATFGGIAGIAVDASGNLYLADSGNQRIREVSATTPPLAATIWAQPGQLIMYTPEGGNSTQPLLLDGAAGTAWQATSAEDAWLSLQNTSGRVPASLLVKCDASQLAPGNYTGKLTISAPGANPPNLTIQVKLRVYAVTPYLYQITNSASGFVSGQDGAGIAQGSKFFVYGSNIGPGTVPQTSSFPLPLTLGGTSIGIRMAGTFYDIPILSTSASQVAALLPSTMPEGIGELTLTYRGSPSQSIRISVVKSAFGIYSVSNDGAGPGVVLDADNRQLSFAQPAHPGDVVTLSGTGLGAVAGEEMAKPLPGNAFRVEVFAGSQAATVQYAGRSGCCAGVDEIVFQIPTAVQGCFVPLVVRSNGVVSNFVTLPIAPAGEACSDPIGPSPALLSNSATGIRYGAIGMGPIPVLESFGAAFLDALAERLSSMLGTKVGKDDLQTIIRTSHSRRSRALQAVMKKYAPMMRARKIDPSIILGMTNIQNYRGVTARFQTATSNAEFAGQFGSALPPPGSCVAGVGSSYRYGDYRIGRGKDAGKELLFTGPAGTQTLTANAGGTYLLALGNASHYSLPAGTYVVSSSGGAEIGPFTASFDVGLPLTWTNQASVDFVDRSAPLTVNWTGGPATGYVVFGGQVNRLTGFTCVADVRDGTLTVPDFVMSAMPHSPNGMLFLMAHPLNRLFTAEGIDVGFFTDMTMNSKTIAFQ